MPIYQFPFQDNLGPDYSLNSQHTLRLSAASISPVRKFKHRERLPLIQNILWKIQSGMVRAVTFGEDGATVTLGLWGANDIVGLPFATVRPYALECLGDVLVRRVSSDRADLLESCLRAHLQQSQAFLLVSHGTMKSRLRQFVSWMADRFGTTIDSVTCVPHALTHQDIAEVIGSNRVTVTRLIGELEKENLIRWERRKFFKTQGTGCS